jgi:hypothetical protein
MNLVAVPSYSRLLTGRGEIINIIDESSPDCEGNLKQIHSGLALNGHTRFSRLSNASTQGTNEIYSDEV